MDIDGFEAVEKQVELIQNCELVVERCVTHMTQFTDTKLDLQEEYDAMRKMWLEQYLGCNEEVTKADRFSLSDLVFVALCHMELAMRPEWRVCAPNDQHIPSVLDLVRFHGCQHTRDTAVWPDDAVLTNIRRCVAWIVVNKLSYPMPEAAAELKRTTRLTFMTDSLEHRMKDLKDFAEPPKNETGEYVRPLELGLFWSDVSILGVFLPQTARIIHGLDLECHVFNMFELETNPPVIENMAALKQQMARWLTRACSIDSSDDFSHDFRNAAFESCLPVNSFNNASSRRSNNSAQVIPLTLLQFELGYDVANAVSESLGTRVRSIGYDHKHMFYQLMMLYMFGYVVYHEQRLEFNKLFFVESSQLLSKLDLVKTCIKFSRNREPLVVRLKRRWFVHYVPKDEITGRWIACADSSEACLYWLAVVRDHHDSDLVSGHNIEEWSKKFLTLHEDD
jgi:hypothetical protein